MIDENLNLPLGNRIHGIKRPRIETPEQISIRNSKARERKKIKKTANGFSPVLKVLVELGKLHTNDACIEYIRLFQGNRTAHLRPEGWLSSPLPYPGREHVEISKIGKIWFPVMDSWLDHRTRVQGFESNKDSRGSIHILADY